MRPAAIVGEKPRSGVGVEVPVLAVELPAWGAAEIE